MTHGCVYLGGGNSHMFNFHPENWRNDPICRAYFSNGWFNHQLENAWLSGSYSRGALGVPQMVVKSKGVSPKNGRKNQSRTHTIRGTRIFTYMNTIKINHSCKYTIIHGWYGTIDCPRTCSWTKSEEVLYEDDEMLVINKPNDLVVHPAPGNWTGTLVPWLLEVYKYHKEPSNLKSTQVSLLNFFSAIFWFGYVFVGKMAEEWISWFYVHPLFCLFFLGTGLAKIFL